MALLAPRREQARAVVHHSQHSVLQGAAGAVPCSVLDLFSTTPML